MKRVVASSALILLLIFIGTAFAILYAKGYRFAPQNGKGMIEGTGLLVLTSKPDGARVLINDHLTTATNNTINLQPGSYEVKIEKDGYFAWKKTVVVKKETVSQANALLFPTAPKYEAITITGADNPVMDSSGTLLAYTVSSSSATKNGVYLIDMNSRPLIPFGNTSTQIANDLADRMSQAKLTFSPDGKEILATLPSSTYLLATTGLNANPRDVTNTLLQVEREWETQNSEKNKKILDSFPRDLRLFAIKTFKEPVPSPEGDKVLYTASASATMPFIRKERVPGENSTPEERDIKEGNIYVYDLKEDRNYLLFEGSGLKNNEASPTYFWHQDSRHLVYAKDAKVNIVEFDGQNLTTIYAGPFLDNHVFPWPDGSSVSILTQFNNSSAPYNLYRIGLQ